jgi:hypothetical protein
VQAQRHIPRKGKRFFAILISLHSEQSVHGGFSSSFIGDDILTSGWAISIARRSRYGRKSQRDINRSPSAIGQVYK